MIQPRITELHNPSYGPPKKRSTKKKKNRRPRSSSNPGPFALTLGALGANPNKEKRTVAKKKKKKASRAPSKANRPKKAKRNNGKKKNPGVSLATVKRLMGGKKKKKKNGRKSSRNPLGMFGNTGAKNVLGISAGILGGVTIAKLVPPMFPAAWTATDFGRFLTTAGVAAGEAVLAHFLLQAPYRDAVWAGAGAQTLSTALNPILRKVSSNITLGRYQQARAMGQLRDFVPGNFPEPHNPIWQQMMLAAAANPAGAPAGGASVGRYRGRFR
jgi:hypothetical protein